MAIKTFTAGAPLLAAEINTNLMNQSVIVTTAAHTSLPTPVEGMMIYETDTDKLLQYTTGTTLWQPPWNLPWGRITPGSNANTSSTVTTLTFPALNKRIYKVSGHAWVTGTSGANKYGSHVVSGAAASATWNWSMGDFAASQNFNFASVLEMTATSTGNIVVTTAIANVTFLLSDGTKQIYWVVEDIGPSAAPA
jgi:hypothetical protein